MKYYNLIYLIIILLVSGCIGPLYNPYPLSKLVAKIGPPLKINSSIEGQSKSEVQSESKEENNLDENSNSENLNQTSSSSNESNDNLDLEVVDDKTILANWKLDISESLILPPVEIINAISNRCLNGNKAQLVTFSSSKGLASALFKCR